MRRKITDALLSLVLDKKARDNLARRRAAAGRSDREARIAEMQRMVDAAVTPESRERIRRAMAARQAKSRILDDLEDEDKRQQYALALKRLLDEDAGGSGGGA